MKHSLNVRSHQKEEIGEYYCISAHFQDFSSWSEIIDFFFFPLPFQFILVEDSLLGPCSIWKVILCMNLFWHLFLPSLFYFIHCQEGILIGMESKWNEALPLRDIHAGTLWELPPFCQRRADFLPFAVFLSDFWCFPGPVSFIPGLPHSQHHKALSAQTRNVMPML